MKDLTLLTDSLEPWMVFIIAMMLVLIPILTEVIRQVRQSRKDKTINTFTSNLYNSQNNIFAQLHRVATIIESSNKDTSHRMTELIDILYEKFANNITQVVAMDIIELVYSRTKLSILDAIGEAICLEDNYSEERFMINRIETTIRTHITNRYFQDERFLNKLTCRGIKLDFHLSKKMDMEDFSNKLLNLISISASESSDILYRQVRTFINNYFTTQISKAKTELDLLTKDS